MHKQCPGKTALLALCVSGRLSSFGTTVYVPVPFEGSVRTFELHIEWSDRHGEHVAVFRPYQNPLRSELLDASFQPKPVIAGLKRKLRGIGIRHLTGITPRERVETRNMYLH